MIDAKMAHELKVWLIQVNIDPCDCWEGLFHYMPGSCGEDQLTAHTHTEAMGCPGLADRQPPCGAKWAPSEQP